MMSARATRTTMPTELSPARANLVSTPRRAAPARATLHPTPTAPAPARDDYQNIKTVGRWLDDIERLRIQGGNRLGHGDAPAVQTAYEGIAEIEQTLRKELQVFCERLPVAQFVKEVRGLGLLSLGRLVAETGDPAERTNPGKLVAYCGHGQMFPKKRGITEAEARRQGNRRARMRTHLIADGLYRWRCENCKQHSKTRAVQLGLKKGQSAPWAPPPPDCTCVADGFVWRAIYDAERLKLVDADITDGHKHNRALRVVGRKFLIELWKYARAGHVFPDTRNGRACAGQHHGATQTNPARAERA